jgi:hypothetical protein
MNNFYKCKPTIRPFSSHKFNYDDPFLFEQQLSSEEIMTRNLAHSYAQNFLLPVVKKSFMNTASNTVANHSKLSFAIICMLTVLVIGMYIYYHGFFILGPYASSDNKSKDSSKDNKKDKSKDSSKESSKDNKKDKSNEIEDIETENLIKSINSSQ